MLTEPSAGTLRVRDFIVPPLTATYFIYFKYISPASAKIGFERGPEVISRYLLYYGSLEAMSVCIGDGFRGIGAVSIYGPTSGFNKFQIQK